MKIKNEAINVKELLAYTPVNNEEMLAAEPIDITRLVNNAAPVDEPGYNDECIVYQANNIVASLRADSRLIQSLRNRISELRWSASGARAISYDKERTSGGTPYTMEDKILDVVQYESELRCAEQRYNMAYLDFYQIMFDAGFDVDQVTLYPKRLLQDWSLGRLANWYHIPKWRVQRLIDRADKKFYETIGMIADGADYS